MHLLRHIAKLRTLALASLAALPMSASAAPSDLLLYYSFDESSGGTITNEAGATDGSIVGGGSVVTGQTGYGQAFQGNRSGANDAAVDTNLDAVALDFASGSYTAMAWVYWNGASGGDDHMIFSQFELSNFLHHGLRADGGDNIVHFGHWTDDIYNAGTVLPNTWTHIAFTYDSSSSPDAHVYVNGVLTGSNITGPLDSAHHNENIAIGFIGGAGSFNGLIDEVKIYSTTLDAAAITAQMAPPGPPNAVDDRATMRHGGKVRIAPLSNDTGPFDPASIQIDTTPAFGTASIAADGTLLYTHTTGTPASDSFTYEISNNEGTESDTGTVSITFSTGRFTTDYLQLPPTPPATEILVEDAFPGLTFDSPHDFSAVEGDSRKLFVTEGDGRVWLIPNVTTNPTDSDKLLILDITDRTNHDNNEKACKGIAPHPDWANNGYIFVTYNADGGGARLSRFTCQTTSPYTAAASSELILIDQADSGGYHNIDTCEFGPEGYLYVSFGDEGTQTDGFDNSQYIDKDLWCSIIRIDIDKKSGSLTPNPDIDIPRIAGGSSGEAHFRIPPDNPFIGATSHNGVSVLPAEVRTEMFVTGLRNPWQFSIEDNDADGETDEIWVGDIGRYDREEIAVYSKGQNGGWAWREGTDTPNDIAGDFNGADVADATLTGPLWDYPHGGGTFEGDAVMAGYLYHDSAIPGLNGKFIAADYASGNIWSIERTAGAPVIERLGGEVAIVAIEPDPSGNGEVLLLDRGNNGGTQGVGGIKRLTVGSDDSSFPQKLTDTNFFADLGDLSPQPGAIPYDANLRFWSDHADKTRWFVIDDVADTVGYSEDGAWTTPEGMRWVKHFDYPTQWESFTRLIDGQNVTDRRPLPNSPSRRVETRFLTRTSTGVYGVSYHWEDINESTAQADAALADDDGERFSIDIALDGAPVSIQWDIPSRAACVTCHTPAAGHTLSFNTRQLNTAGSIGGVPGNQISLLDSIGYVTGAPSTSPTNLPRHLRPDQTQYSLEARARSWLDVNCAYCHQDGGTGGGDWDGSLHLKLADTGLVNGLPVDAPLDSSHRLLIPGDVDRSIVYNRAAAANGYSRMPPLATYAIDYEGVQLLADWIASEMQSLPTYDDFRLFHFGDLVSQQGAADENPDGDNNDNRDEWLANTDPNDISDNWGPVMRLDGDAVEIEFTGLGNRSVLFERSLDLINWTTWPAPGNDGIPLNPDTVHTLTAPSLDREFFRLSIEEN